MSRIARTLDRIQGATEPPAGPDRWFWPLLAVLVVGAVAIRWGRLPIIWDYWAIDYVSYVFYHWEDLSQGRLPWTRLIGMHPGQYALGMATLLKLGGSMHALLWLPIVASCGSAVVGALWVRRQVGSAPGLLFAALMAISPYQAHYGVELNNYPLFQLVGSLLVVLTWACWDRPNIGRLVALGAAVTAALHTHFFLVPLLAVLGVVVIATRRWRILAALAAGVVPALPVLITAAVLPSESASYTGEVSADLLLVETFGAWIGRFSTAHSLLGVALATVLGALFTLRAHRTRRSGVMLLVVVACLCVVNYIGFVTGAARIFQSPYWVLPSWCTFALIALGCGAARRVLSMAPLLVLVVWFAESSHRAALPRSAAEARVGVWTDDGVQLLSEPPDADELAAYLDDEFEERDIVLYLWDAMYINDQPHRYDPLFAAFPPRDVGAWDPESVSTGFGSTFRGGTVYFHNTVPLRGDDYEIALTEAVEQWIGEGRRVHVVVGSLDPELPVPDPSSLRQTVVSRGGRWTERRLAQIRLAVIEPALP